MIACPGEIRRDGLVNCGSSRNVAETMPPVSEAMEGASSLSAIAIAITQGSVQRLRRSPGNRTAPRTVTGSGGHFPSHQYQQDWISPQRVSIGVNGTSRPKAPGPNTSSASGVRITEGTLTPMTVTR